MSRKKILLLLVSVVLLVPAVRAGWDLPYSADSGSGYHVGYNTYDYNDYIEIFKEGNFFTYGYYGESGSDSWDDGPATIHYEAVIYHWWGTENDYAEVQINAPPPPPNNAPYQAFDAADDTVYKQGHIWGGGWAADIEDGAPVVRVEVFIDGNYIGNADLGGSRPDVAAYFGRGDWDDSGYNFWINVGDLSFGGHTVMTRAVDSQGATADSSKSFNVPNRAPSIAWTQAPSTVYINESFTVEARGNDEDGNLTNVDVWRDSTPFAFAGGGNGFEGYSGNPHSSSTPGTIAFAAQARDGSGATAESSTHTVNVVNRAPDSTTLSSGGVTQIYLGQSVNLSTTIHDADGNLTFHMIWWNNSGTWTEVPNIDYHPNSGSYSSKDATFTPPGIGVWELHANGNDTYDWGPNAFLTIEVVNRPPDSPTISTGGVTQINLGQSVNLTGTLHDPDGNLAYHMLYYKSGASWVDLPGVSGSPSGGSNSTKNGSFTPTSVGTWEFHNNGHDNYAWGPGSSVSVTVVDGTAPSTPGGLSASNNTTGTSFTLSWSASSDNVGVTGYEVKRGSTSLGTTTTLSMNITGLADGVTYGMSIRARDAANNWSAWSSVLNVTTPDITPPSVPAGLAAIGNTTGNSFTLTWGVSSDNVGVTGYEVKRGSTSLGTTTTVEMNITGLSQATQYAMSVRARDAAGNWSAWCTAFNVTTPDVDAPQVTTGLSASNILGTSFRLNWSATTDNVGVTNYEVKRDSTSLGLSGGQLYLDVTGLTQGTTYSMTVRARDAAGNWSAWSSAISVMPLNPAGDLDGDGMTNGWESQYGLNPNSAADALQNADGDPAINLTEFLFGTNPTVAEGADTSNQSQLNTHRPTP